MTCKISCGGSGKPKERDDKGKKRGPNKVGKATASYMKSKAGKDIAKAKDAIAKAKVRLNKAKQVAHTDRLKVIAKAKPKKVVKAKKAKVVKAKKAKKATGMKVMTVPELKTILKSSGGKGYSKLKKGALLSMVKKAGYV
jgi:hypothetical protein